MSQGRPSKIWLMSGEASRALGVSKPTLEKLARTGLIGTLLIPGIGHRRYSAADVAALVAGGTNAKRREELVEA